MGFFDKLFGKKEKEQLDKGLEKTREGFFSRVTKAIAGKSQVDDEVLDQLEEAMISADVGVDTTLAIIEKIQARVARDKYLGTDELNGILQEEIRAILVDDEKDTIKRFELPEGKKPFVVLVVGVNGVGKTTTIGKMAWQYASMGKKVVLGAGDTFRAAAVDQLGIWKDRTGAEIISHGMNTDPSSVAFDAVKYGVDSGADVVIIDTAGRLHNKVSLMNELAKMKRVIQKFQPEAPQEIVLVIDATTGQNAYEQARNFTAATQVNTLAVTKLDGTARGGVVIGVSEQFNIPVKYIGLGEKAEDLKLFDKKLFVQSLFQS